MITRIIRFCNIVMVALVAGTIFGIWIGFNPKDLSAPTFIEQQQNTILALNTLMPILGFITILLTIISAFLLRKKDKIAFTVLLIASLFLIVSGLITKFGNQPINSIVMSWNMNIPPDNWIELRNQWWIFHEIRTLTAFIGLCLIIWTNIRKD